jgi:uncharacterized protein (DUF983 family)
MSQQERKPGLLNLLKCKCPRCRRGNMFQNNNPWRLKHTMKMNEKCSVCGQPFNIEVGFYYGTGYVSYVIAILLSIATFFVWWMIIGFSLNDNRVFYWLAFNAIFLIVMQPYLMRLSRTLWLAFFVGYDNDWKTQPMQSLERTNKDQESNW